MQKESIDLFTLFDDGADVYFHIPVNEADSSLLPRAMRSSLL